MTLASKSPVTRETSAQYRRRRLCVTVASHLLIMREKGRRDSLEVPLDAIYDLGLKLRARQRLAEKRSARG